jgi:hypothetical protein
LAVSQEHGGESGFVRRAGILLVFPEPIAASVGLLRLEFRYPHAVAFVLAAVAVLMQWMWPERAQPRPS